MYHKVECVTLECDNCKEQFVEYHNGFSIFVDQNQAHENADNAGWYLGEKHYCPNCHTNDDDILILKQL